MRILQLSQFIEPVIGGEERHVQTLSRILASRGHDVTLLTYATVGDEGVTSDGPVRVVRVRSTASRVPGLYSDPTWPHAMPVPDPAVHRAVAVEIAKIRPDVAHAHNWIVNSALSPLRRNNVPLVLTMHDYGQVCATQRLMEMRSSECAGPGIRKCLACSAEKFGWARGGATVIGNGIMSRRRRSSVSRFVSVSDAVATRVSGGRLGAASLTRGVSSLVIPNFIPDDEPVDKFPCIEKDAPIVFVGDLSRDKGIHVLLEAYANLDAPPPLKLVGRMTPETPHHLPTGATAIGPVPHAEVIDAVRSSRLLVAPSTWQEPCPTVVLEGMAAGIPVIASAVGGITDMVVDGETGLLVPHSDAVALEAALRRLLGDADIARSMGEAGRDRVRSFTASAVVERIERLYFELVGLD